MLCHDSFSMFSRRSERRSSHLLSSLSTELSSGPIPVTFSPRLILVWHNKSPGAGVRTESQHSELCCVLGKVVWGKSCSFWGTGNCPHWHSSPWISESFLAPKGWESASADLNCWDLSQSALSRTNKTALAGSLRRVLQPGQARSAGFYTLLSSQVH